MNLDVATDLCAFAKKSIRKVTSKMFCTYSYFRARSSISGLTNCKRSEADKIPPEVTKGLKGLSKQMKMTVTKKMSPNFIF